MAFHKTNKDASAVKDGGNSKYIGKSGIYPVTVLAPFVDDNGKGSLTVNFAVDYEGQTQAIYGNLRLTNNDGGENKIGSELFNKLCVIAGVDDVQDPIEGTLPIGKAGADKDVSVLEDFADLELMVRIQMEYGFYNGKTTEKTAIRAFYSATGASAAEIINETPQGVQLEKDRAYENNITYKDGLDAESVATWIAGGRKDGGSAPTAAAKPSFAKKPSFGKK